MTSTVYKGRTITIESAGSISRDDNLFDDFPTSRNEHKRVIVNGSAQFSFQGDDRFILGETQRYIDAVDAAEERARQKASALWRQTAVDNNPKSKTYGQVVPAPGYWPIQSTDYAPSWRAAA